MNKNQERVEIIKLLINELHSEFEKMRGVAYKIEIESYDDTGEYLIGAQESNDWERSWC